MTLGLIEAAVDALHTYLSANFAAKVATLNTRYSDAYPLIDVKTWYKGGLPHVFPEVPSACLLGTSVDVRPATMGRASTQVMSRIDILFMVGDDSIEARFRKLSRYALGTLELLQAGEASYGYRHEIPDVLAISDLLTEPQFLQAIRVPVIVRRNESY